MSILACPERNEVDTQYGSITLSTSSEDVLMETMQKNSSSNDSYRYDYDCSICLERLKNPAWCGQGNCSMRSCRSCLIKWCENRVDKCPHCQVKISKATIKCDDRLRIKMEEEQDHYPLVMKQVKEQKFIIVLQQQQLAVMKKRIETLQKSKSKLLQREKKVVAYVCVVMLGLWLCSFWFRTGCN